MKHLLKLFLFGMVVLFSISNSYAKPKDVKGFDNFQIGMTVDQIIKTYSGPIEREQRTKSTNITLVIPSYKVGKYYSKVLLDMNQNKELVKIRIFFSVKGLYTKGDSVGREKVFTDLKNMLFEKYGTSRCEDIRDLYSKCEWFFPSSKVEFVFFRVLKLDNRFCFSIDSKENILETEANLRKGYELELLEGYNTEHKLTLNSEKTDLEGYIIVTGQVKNISKKTLKNVQVMSIWYDRYKPNRIISYETALIEFNPLPPGQVSPFKIIADYKTGMGNQLIEFKYLGGSKIPTYDKLNLFTGEKW